jgi:hypothetical protein
VLAPAAPQVLACHDLAYMHKYETRKKGAMDEVTMQYDARKEHPKHKSYFTTYI